MEGFFSKKETQSSTRPDGKVLSCVSCGLSTGCDTPKMPHVGGGRLRILNICENPSQQEDSSGKPYTGRYPRMLQKMYKEVGIDLDEDCWNVYAVKCNAERIQPNHVDCCRRILMSLIKTLKPQCIVLFGDIALEAVIGGRWKKDLGTIQKWRGYTIPDQELKAFVIPMLSPAFVDSSKNKVIPTIWRQDFSVIPDKVKEAFPIQKEPEIIYLEEHELNVFDTIQSGHVSFDYETTGIKPHAPGHRIICASVAVNTDKVYVFMMPQTRAARKPFVDLLERESVMKSAQNMKFEDTWSSVRLQCEVKNWFYDTLLATHIIDNRSGVKGLKFQTYVQLGIIDYDSEVSPYLKSKQDTNDANGINQIEELIVKPGGAKLLMKYCALDSIYERRIAEATSPHMLGTVGESPISPSNSSFPHAYQLLHAGTLALTKAERQGIRVDTEYAEKMEHRLNKKVEALESRLFESAFYRRWKHTIGERKPNLNSNKQLETYLYKTLKLKPMKYTENGYGSTDEEALKLLNIPELDMIVERSKLQKIRDTYLKGFVREQVNGYLHPFFNLHLARTYRSSSSNPNFQNIPKRDYLAMQTVRKALYARPGHQLLEMDYSGIEVAIAAAYHKDPTMIKYVTDPTTDMHGDTAAEMFLIKNFDKHNNKAHSMLRSATKNSFVFPQFYGDYYKNCAVNVCANWIKMPTSGVWKDTDGIEMDGCPLGTHMRKQGIKSYEDFEEHVREIEESFWKVRFPVYAQWKEDHYDEYLKNGYVALKTGFVCKGVMSKNDAINYPVQGAAFHCLLWTFTRLSEEMERKGMDSKLIGQIHDALVFDVHPDELVQVYEMAQDIGVRQLREQFKWINVPLQLEAELCPVDGSWAEKQEWKP